MFLQEENDYADLERNMVGPVVRACPTDRCVTKL
jgi:hypothetical protein